VPRRLINVDGDSWTVAPSGHYTQYNKDEFTVVFQKVGRDGDERVARYSPLGTKQREDSLARLTDRELVDLFRRSQPSWTTPETGYRR
jgi:hypothetical protein